MTVLALKMANQRSAVSQLHGKVTRRMWHGLWPEVPEDNVPIAHVTNGIHVPTWIAAELGNLFKKYLGEDWINKHDETILWERLRSIPNMEHNREWAHCCGSVLTLIKEPPVAADIGKARLDEAMATGAEKVLALCPCCQFQFRVTAEKKGLTHRDRRPGSLRRRNDGL